MNKIIYDPIEVSVSKHHRYILKHDDVNIWDECEICGCKRPIVEDGKEIVTIEEYFEKRIKVQKCTQKI